MSKQMRLGIAGLGTVGIGVIKIVQQHADLLEARTGCHMVISAVSARSRDRDRGVDLSAYAWESDPVALARRADVDLVIEVMGGENGAAKATIEAAIANGKDVVTANKALLAVHGMALAEAAEAADVSLRFEAAVAGGIPVVKALTEGMAGNEMTRVMGVMNGTCNYILTEMERTGASYVDVLADAQKLGYAEADPSFDVGGIDAAHKLALLAATAFGTCLDFEGIDVTGIERVNLEDITYAAELGYRIKLLGVARQCVGGIDARMQPCLVPSDSVFGELDGVANLVVLEGDSIGRILLGGPGAGEGPTASAIMGDVADIARGLRIPAFGVPANQLKPASRTNGSGEAAYYLRLTLHDKPGALARVTAILGEAKVSVDRMRQTHHDDGFAPVLIVTHPTELAQLDAALTRIATLEVSAAAPVALRIEDA